jgi:hypothetical protein
MKSLFVGLLTGSLLAGCMLTTDSTEALQVAVTISPSTIRRGDTASVTVQLINPTIHSTTVSGSSGCRLTFDILDQNGVRVGGEIPGYCTADIKTLVLEPGQSDTRTFSWAAVRALDQPLPDGSYTVVGASLWLGGRRSAPQPFVVVAH